MILGIPCLLALEHESNDFSQYITVVLVDDELKTLLTLPPRISFEILLPTLCGFRHSSFSAPMAQNIDVAAVLAQFDHLQATGELFYTPSRPVRHKEGDLEVRYLAHYFLWWAGCSLRICNVYSHKLMPHLHGQ